MIEQADHSTSTLQSTQRPIFGQDDRRQVAAVAIGECTFVAIVDAQEQGGVFFRRRALVELVIQQRK